MVDAGGAEILETDISNQETYLKIQYDNALIEELTITVGANGEKCYEITDGEIINYVIEDNGNVFVDGVEIKPLGGLGMTAVAWSTIMTP